MRTLGIILVCFLLVTGCAATNGRYGLRPPTHATEAQAKSAGASAAPRCPDRINRARAGGTVGSVVGFVAASALGSPLLGILYNVAGYGAGFASADNCKNQKAPVTTAQAPSQAASQSSRSSLPPLPADNIAEEDLK